MIPNMRFNDFCALLVAADPVSQAASTVTTAYVPVQNFHTFVAMVDVGAFGASATVDANIQQATSSGGAGAKALTGKAITQLLAAGGNNRQAFINFRPQDLDTNNGYAFVALQIIVGTAATVVSGHLFGITARFDAPVDSTANPAINLGAATVAQIV